MGFIASLTDSLHGSELLFLLSVCGIAGFFSGLSGFGFSAIGSLILLVLPPLTAIPLLMAVSVMIQACSFFSLAAVLRDDAKEGGIRKGVAPYLIGGVLGTPLGLYILSHADHRELMYVLGTLLILFASYSILLPNHLSAPVTSQTGRNAFLVGTVGGVIGGCTAFPSAPIVIWMHLLKLTKMQARAITQPYILLLQLVGLSILLITKTEVFTGLLGLLLMASLPVAIMGNQIGVLVFKMTLDHNYRRITMMVLGLCGAGLLLQLMLGSSVASA